MQITVVVPVYNEAAAAVRNHLDMLVAAGADEIIIVDDGSAEPVTAVDGRVKFSIVRHATNLGVPAALNTGLHHTTTPHVLFSAVGDRLMPGYLDQIRAWGATSMRVADETYTARARFIRADGFAVESADFGFQQADKRFGYYYDPLFLAGADARGQLQLISHVTVFCTNHVRETGFIKALRWHCDWHLTHSVALRHGICFIPIIAGEIKVSPDSYSGRGMRDWRAQFNIVMWMRNFTRIHTYGTVMVKVGSFGFFGWPAILYALICDRELINFKFLRKAFKRTAERFAWRHCSKRLLTWLAR